MLNLESLMRLIEKVLTPKNGTKFIITLVSLFGIYDMTKSGFVETIYALIAMVLIVLGYYVTDTIQKKNGNGSKEVSREKSGDGSANTSAADLSGISNS